jgi:enoyl-CoA hydratase
MIGVTRDGKVLTLEMQRAERRNALNGALVDGLREEIEKASALDVRAIVLTGQGTVFSAGADLSDAEGVAKDLPDKALALNLAIDASPVPIIAALNGRLVSLVGHGRARGMLIAAERLDLETALMTGMVNRTGTLADAQEWAAEIAGYAPLSIAHSKRVLNDDGAYDNVRGDHTRMFNKAWASPDVIEAQVARFEKRPPNFLGA